MKFGGNKMSFFMQHGYCCESGITPDHVLSDSMDNEFEMMMSKARNKGHDHNVACKECYKKIPGKKKIIFKSQNLYVYVEVKV